MTLRDRHSSGDEAVDEPGDKSQRIVRPDHMLQLSIIGRSQVRPPSSTTVQLSITFDQVDEDDGLQYLQTRKPIRGSQPRPSSLLASSGTLGRAVRKARWFSITPRPPFEPKVRLSTQSRAVMQVVIHVHIQGGKVIKGVYSSTPTPPSGIGEVKCKRSSVISFASRTLLRLCPPLRRLRY